MTEDMTGDATEERDGDMPWFKAQIHTCKIRDGWMTYLVHVGLPQHWLAWPGSRECSPNTSIEPPVGRR